jgi:hypothetical protein
LNLNLYCLGSEGDGLPFRNFHVDSYPWPINGDQDLAIDLVSFRGGSGLRISGICTGLSRADRFLPLRDGSSRREPEQCRERPKASSSYEKRASPKSYPPLRTRLPLALGIGLGSNGVLIWGLLITEKGWRIRGVLLCILAVMMMLGGIGLALTIGIPSTWGWLV